MKTKLEDLKPGSTVKVDGGFTCMKANEYRVKKDGRGLYLRCDDGKHYLDSQVGADGYLIGVEKVK